MTVYIELRSTEDGDWYELVVNGEIFHEGHSIPNYAWLKLLETMGAQTSQSEIPSEYDDDADYCEECQQELDPTETDRCGECEML
jgi:hypothetical protein